MKYLQNIISKSDIVSFTERLSKILLADHAIKIKPIKLLHCIAKALGFKNWNHYQATKVPATGLQHYPSAELEDSTPSGKNKYIIGESGSGKSNHAYGLLLDYVAYQHHFKRYENIVVVDVGRSYHHLSLKLGENIDFIVLETSHFQKLAPIKPLGKMVTILELEGLKPCNTEQIANQVIKQLELLVNERTLVIVDEWWSVHKNIKDWALSVFTGETLAITQCETDFTYDKCQHLFEGGIKMARHSFS